MRWTGRRRAVAVFAVVIAMVGTPTAQSRPNDGSSSPYRWRGVVEGTYQQPWTASQRQRVLTMMAAHQFNAYAHAPKGDAYQRIAWRMPYPDTDQAIFDSEIAWAADHGIAWIPNVSPALPLGHNIANSTSVLPPSQPLCFSCESDLHTVAAKLGRFIAAGARWVMVSFDDIPKQFSHGEDLARFGPGDNAFGRANGEFLTRLLELLRSRWPDVGLFTVLADYSGTSTTPYLDGVRVTLDPAVEVMWTGRFINSSEMTDTDVAGYAAAIGRTPIIWDNWNCHQAEEDASTETLRTVFGPYWRRNDLAGHIGGVFLNPPNEADLALIPFAAAGDWMADPTHTDPRAAYLDAVRTMGGPVAEVLRAFTETSYASLLQPETQAPTFVALADAFVQAYIDPQAPWPAAAAALRQELRLVASAGDALSGQPQLAYFVSDATAFLAAAGKAAAAGIEAVGLLTAERPSLEISRVGGAYVGRALPPTVTEATEFRHRLLAAQTAARADPHGAYGSRTGVILDNPPITLPPNVMDVFIETVLQLDAAWTPNAQAASSAVSLALNGEPVPLATDGSFRLPPHSHGLLVATDGAGGTTTLVLGTAALPA